MTGRTIRLVVLGFLLGMTVLLAVVIADTRRDDPLRPVATPMPPRWCLDLTINDTLTTGSCWIEGSSSIGGAVWDGGSSATIAQSGRSISVDVTVPWLVPTPTPTSPAPTTRALPEEGPR